MSLGYRIFSLHIRKHIGANIERKWRNKIQKSDQFFRKISLLFRFVLTMLSVKTTFVKSFISCFCISGGFRVRCSQLWCSCTNALLTRSLSNALFLARVKVTFSFRASIGYGIAQCSLCNYVLLVDISNIEGVFFFFFLSSLRRQINFVLLYWALSLV